MHLRFLTIAAAATLFAQSVMANPDYDKKMDEYMAHLKDMQIEADQLAHLADRFDKSSKACLDDLEAGNKGLVCMHMKKDKMDFEYEYKKFTTYNRIRKVSKFEVALQGMMEREMFSLQDKAKANEMFKSHMDAKSERQSDITKLGEQVYGAIERYNKLADERLERINELKKK